MTFKVEDDGSEPHLKRGEYAVVDTTDRELQHGELYVIQHQSGNRPRRIVQVKARRLSPKQQAWWCSDLRGFRPVGIPTAGSGGIPEYTGVSDGPYRAEGLIPKLVGRVVGYAVSSMGKRLDPAAGWENEDIGNAEFDPREYIDVLIRCGFRPRLQRVQGGGWYYIEMMPEKAMTNQQWDEQRAVRTKWLRASRAKSMVEAECERRGLFA
jgi:hypothetical protein